jgi:hypothetical protein
MTSVVSANCIYINRVCFLVDLVCIAEGTVGTVRQSVAACPSAAEQWGQSSSQGYPVPVQAAAEQWAQEDSQWYPVPVQTAAEQWAQGDSQWYPVPRQTAAEQWAQRDSQSLQSMLLAAGPSLCCSVNAHPYFILFMAW